MTSLPSKPVEALLFPDVKYQRRYQVNLLKIFFVIVSGLGLIWYTLTRVTRAPFPSEDLASWSLAPIPELNLAISFRIHLSQSDWATLLKTKLQTQRYTTPGPIVLTPVFQVQTTDSIPVTNWTMSDLPVVNLPRLEAKNKEDLTYDFILIPGNELGLYISERVPLSVYILFPSEVKYDKIQNLLLHGFKEILNFLSDHDSSKLEVDYFSQYQLLFTSLHGSPPSEDGFLGSPLAYTVEDIIMPSVTSLQPLSQFEVATQAQYYAPLTINPEKQVSQEGSSWYKVDPQQQTLFINSAWDLASVSPAPDLHFLIFVPPPELAPLHLVDQNGVKVPSNSFIVPQWGGLVILNPDDSGKIKESQVREAITIHLNHFHDLVGLVSPKFKPFSTMTFKFSPHGLSPLAFDRYRLRRIAFFASKTTTTLYALNRLINAIPAMEVSYESMKSVKKSINDLVTGRQALAKGNISLALFKFNKAFLSSEASFFHPSMVAQMYFPPDATYAIFLPLLLPAVLPLIMTTIKLIRNLKKTQN